MNRKLTDNEKKTLNEFLEFYSKCPICKNKIQKSHLLDFYFKKDLDSINLKKKLLNLMKQSKNFDEKIIVGIPSCICFSKFFPNKKIVYNLEINKELYAYLSPQDVEQMLSFLFE